MQTLLIQLTVSISMLSMATLIGELPTVHGFDCYVPTRALTGQTLSLSLFLSLSLSLSLSPGGGARG